MNPVAASGVQYRVPPEPSRWPAIALAAAVHAGLLAFLYIGVSWQNTAPVAVEAEVWDMKTQAAAPPPPPPPEVVEPEPVPTPAPAPRDQEHHRVPRQYRRRRQPEGGIQS
jgi:colicin import membrane protein